MDKVWRGAALRRARMLSERSIQDVAGALGVTEGAVSSWETALVNPSPEHLDALSHLYSMPLDTLLDRPEAPLSVHEWYERYRQTRPYQSKRRAIAAPGTRHQPRQADKNGGTRGPSESILFDQHFFNPSRVFAHQRA